MPIALQKIITKACPTFERAISGKMHQAGAFAHLVAQQLFDLYEDRVGLAVRKADLSSKLGAATTLPSSFSLVVPLDQRHGENARDRVGIANHRISTVVDVAFRKLSELTNETTKAQFCHRVQVWPSPVGDRPIQFDLEES